MIPAFLSELFLFAVPLAALGGLLFGPPLLAYWLANLAYAAYARTVGIPKPENGYDLWDVCGGWLVAACVAWVLAAARFAVTHRPAFDAWVEKVDRLFF